MTTDISIQELVNKVRSNTFDVMEAVGIGHGGGSLSIVEILVALYYGVAKVDARNPGWEDRDRIILSKGHACESMYAVLGEKGFFPKEKFKEYLQFNSMLQGHTERRTPGVEYSGGSLGQGISFACGVAYAAKLQKKNFKVYCILGDGECHEGEVWEAAMFASHYKLDNLYAIVDYNHYCDHDDVDKMMNLQPFDSKWKSFGWEVIYENKGNDANKLIHDLRQLETISGKPKCIIADTVKNFGVPSWEKAHLHQVAGKDLCDGIKEGRELLKK